jgi:hypothetical protein
MDTSVSRFFFLLLVFGVAPLLSYWLGVIHGRRKARDKYKLDIRMERLDRIG